MTTFFISVIGCLAATANGADEFAEQILRTMVDSKANISEVDTLAQQMGDKAGLSAFQAVLNACDSVGAAEELLDRIAALEAQAATCGTWTPITAQTHYYDGKKYLPIGKDCPGLKAAGHTENGYYRLTSGTPRTAFCFMQLETASEGMPILSSCKAILDFRKAQFGEDADTASGVHTISVAGAEYDVWCDMTHDGGGWTICYNHNMQNLEEIDHSTAERLTTIGGTPGETNEYYANCAGIGAALVPAATRICTKACENWIELIDAPATFHSDFWTCAGSSAVGVKVRTWTSGDTVFDRSYNHHDCPSGGAYGGNAINQIANAGNTALCFEHNGRHQSVDSNHHWAVWGNCDGTYVQNDGNNDRSGWARIMFR